MKPTDTTNAAVDVQPPAIATTTISDGLARLAYHAALAQFIVATRQWVSGAKGLHALSAKLDPKAPDQPEEIAAQHALFSMLRELVTESIGFQGLFAAVGAPIGQVPA